MKKVEKIYPLEFKQSSVQLAINSDQSIAQTARDLGINANTLHGWIRKYGKTKTSINKTGIDLQEENYQLRKENARLKEERDILKKAAAYFANQTS